MTNMQPRLLDGLGRFARTMQWADETNVVLHALTVDLTESLELGGSAVLLAADGGFQLGGETWIECVGSEASKRGEEAGCGGHVCASELSARDPGRRGAGSGSNPGLGIRKTARARQVRIDMPAQRRVAHRVAPVD